MKVLIVASALLASTLCFAQTTPAPVPQPPVATAEPNTDPTADTNDPTLLKAQIMILDNAQEASRRTLSQLADFKDYEKYGNLAAAKRQKLQTVLQAQQVARQSADATKAKARQQQTQTLKEEEAAIAKTNDVKNAEKKKADALKKNPPTHN